MLNLKKYIPNKYKKNLKQLLRNCIQSLGYYLLERNVFKKNCKDSTNIVFICKGNVCRSAFAECRLKLLMMKSSVKVDSCGLDVKQGTFPPLESVKVAAEFSCDLANRRAKSLEQCDLDKADLILPMEYYQYQRLLKLYPHKKRAICLLRSFAPFPYCLFCNIADPYGWGIDEFRKSFRLIDKILQNFLINYISPQRK